MRWREVEKYARAMHELVCSVKCDKALTAYWYDQAVINLLVKERVLSSG